MTSAIVLSSGGCSSPPLAADLAVSGIDLCGETSCSSLPQDVIRKAADIVVCFQDAPDGPFFASLAALAATAPCPVVVFTMDSDAGKMATATASGVHAYVVAGYSRNRLRSVIQLAQARFRHEQMLRQELDDIRKRFDEGRLVDRAKAILMGAQQLREGDAFHVIRHAAMASKQRIGQVSQVLIDTAHYAEAVNRAGQLRMLSQRIVKFYALACTGVTTPETQGLFADSVAQVGAILAILDRSLSEATFGDLVAAVLDGWVALQAMLKLPPAASRVQAVDRLAEHLLDHAETLTANLEVTAFATALHAINVAGRQRMLSQRLAKEVLMRTLIPATQPGAATTTLDEVAAGLDYLDKLPLTNAEIAHELAGTHLAWQAFQQCLATQATPAGCAAIATSSEVLLGHFDRLTDMIERGVHSMTGLKAPSPVPVLHGRGPG